MGTTKKVRTALTFVVSKPKAQNTAQKFKERTMRDERNMELERRVIYSALIAPDCARAEVSVSTKWAEGKCGDVQAPGSQSARDVNDRAQVVVVIFNIVFIVAVDRRPDRLDAFPEVEPWVLSIVDRIVWIHSEG